MKFASRALFLLGITVVLAGCHSSEVNWFPAAKDARTMKASDVNCVELKRQRLYNQTNMNTETNNTMDTQRQALDDLIAKNCQ
jgi:hypothetical protein